MLVVVPTANVWSKTELMLQSLTANSDSYEMLVRPLPSQHCLVIVRAHFVPYACVPWGPKHELQAWKTCITQLGGRACRDRAWRECMHN